MRQLAVEARRFRSRRTITIVLLLGLAATLLLAASTIWSTRSATETEFTEAQQQLQSESSATREDHERCLADPPPGGGDATAEERCQELEPQLDWFLPRETLDLGDQTRSSGLALALLLAGGAIVVGTTFAGADWNSGALSTQLLFRPRRLRLWWAKAVAVTLGVGLWAAALTAGYWTALALVASARELPVTADLLSEVALHGARAVLLAAACALGAYALTMALRSTMVTLGLLFAYTVAGEALWASLPFTRAGQWSLATNVQAWVLDGVEVFDQSVCDPPGRGCDPTYLVSGAHGAAYLGVLLVVAVVVSLLSFRRRDIP